MGHCFSLYDYKRPVETVSPQIPDFLFKSKFSMTNENNNYCGRMVMIIRMEKTMSDEDEEEDECHSRDSRFFVQINIPMFS